MTCEKCGKPWEDLTYASTPVQPPEQKPAHSHWGEIIFTCAVAVPGYIFFGVFGAIVAVAVGIIISLGDIS